MNEKYYRDIKGQVFQYNPNTGDWEKLEIKLTEELLSLTLQTHNGVWHRKLRKPNLKRQNTVVV